MVRGVDIQCSLCLGRLCLRPQQCRYSHPILQRRSGAGPRPLPETAWVGGGGPISRPGGQIVPAGWRPPRAQEGSGWVGMTAAGHQEIEYVCVCVQACAQTSEIKRVTLCCSAAGVGDST